MSQYIPNENKLVTCPYDEAHKVKESRLQLHIAKCKLNHLDKLKKPCSFNASHLLPIGEYEYHLSHCPDRAPLDRHLAQAVDKNNPFKGRTDVPQYSDPINDNEELWETDAQQIQLPPPPIGAVLEPGEFAKPSERKRFYQDLHLLPKKEEAAPKTSAPVSAKKVHVPPRQPKQHSIIEDSNKPNAKILENIGLGRGKPAANSRLAANFPNTGSQVNSSYNIIVQDMNNLGLGRGKFNNPNNNAPASIFDDDDDDDFPPLGRGNIIYKQNVRRPGEKRKN